MNCRLCWFLLAQLNRDTRRPGSSSGANRTSDPIKRFLWFQKADAVKQRPLVVVSSINLLPLFLQEGIPQRLIQRQVVQQNLRG